MNEDIIDRYLHHQLNDQELADFEMRLQQDPQLQKELNLMRGIKLGATLQGREQKILHFQNLEKQIALKETDNQGLNPTWPWFMKLAVAASLVMAITISYFFFFDQRQTPEKLYSNYYKSYPNYLVENTRGEDHTQNPLYVAMQAYEAKDFNLTISELKKVLAANPHNHAIRTYLGLAFLENNQPQSAVVYLQAAWNAKDQEYGATAGWYLSLAWLKMGEVERSKKILQDLQNSQDQFYADKATRLLEEM